MLENNDMSENMGEQSELYTFLRLLSTRQINAVDERAVLINDIAYPIKKIIWEEIAGFPIEYVVNGYSVEVKSDLTHFMSIDRMCMAINSVTDKLLSQ